MRKNIYILLCILFAFAGCSNLPAEHTVVSVRSGEIRLPIKDFSDGKVHFFTYKKDGKRINFFVRTDGKANLSAYFDACYTCYKHKKGYREEGSDLVCNECNLKFRLAEEHWDTSHGCCPISIKSRIDGTELVIASKDLEKGEKLF
ncbi:MAG: Fe-S-containing protein [Nitrospiraceae bacterium]|nr:Fe-S-containing protein [Nitrospiraceae bacterium]